MADVLPAGTSSKRHVTHRNVRSARPAPCPVTIGNRGAEYYLQTWSIAVGNATPRPKALFTPMGFRSPSEAKSGLMNERIKHSNQDQRFDWYLRFTRRQMLAGLTPQIAASSLYVSPVAWR